MNLYTNTIPFFANYSPDHRQIIIPTGSTFGLVAVGGHGFILKPPKSISDENEHVTPEVFKIAFKEVELGE